jgi:hypothetical protein
MRLSYSLVAIGCAAIFLTGCGATSPGTTPPVSPATKPVQSYAPWFRFVSGKVVIKRNGVSVPATEKTTIQTDDEIITNASSTADIIWPKYGHTLIAENSVVDVMTSKDAGTSITEKLALVAGRVWTRLQKTLGSDSYFGITASNVTSVVRGTSFGVELSSTGVTVEVMDSTVGVSIDNGPETYVQETTMTTIHPGDKTVPSPIVMPLPVTANPFLLEGNTLLSDEELHATSSDMLPKTAPVSITWNKPQACPQYGAPNNCYGMNDQICGGYDKWAISCATFI